MEDIITTLIPIFSLILLGYWFKWTKFPSVDFWPMADKFTYYVLMPALLVYKLASTPVALDEAVNLVATALISITLVFFILIALNVLFRFEGKAFTSILQGGIRFNTYVLLAFVGSVYGDSGLVLAAIVIAFVIPYINILCISSFALYTQKGNFSYKSFIKTILKNPLILACALGGGLNIADISLPVTIMKSLDIISGAALPMGLLSVGVGLEFKYLRLAKKELFVSTFAKLVLFPVLIYGVGTLMNLGGVMMSIAVIFGSMPTAVSAYILARQLGGDTRLMASIITVETLACMVPLFFIIPLL